MYMSVLPACSTLLTVQSMVDIIHMYLNKDTRKEKLHMSNTDASIIEFIHTGIGFINKM